jgi:hypothetical protein
LTVSTVPCSSDLIFLFGKNYLQLIWQTKANRLFSAQLSQWLIIFVATLTEAVTSFFSELNPRQMANEHLKFFKEKNLMNEK